MLKKRADEFLRIRNHCRAVIASRLPRELLDFLPEVSRGDHPPHLKVEKCRCYLGSFRRTEKRETAVGIRKAGQNIESVTASYRNRERMLQAES